LGGHWERFGVTRKCAKLKTKEEAMRVLISTLLLAALCTCVILTGCSPVESRAAIGEQPAGDGEAVLINIYDHMAGPASGEATPDWGYSALIRYRGRTILFDGGTSPVILEHNAKALGVDLTEVDTVVLSHSHGDHTGGINHVIAVNPDVAIYVPYDWGFAAGGPDEDPQLRKGYLWPVEEYRVIDDTTEIAEGVHLIYTSSPHTGTFWKYPPYEKEPRHFELKELSLALTTKSGDVFLVVGCSHSGVDEIVKATKEALDADVALVTGGFHLNPYDREYVTEIARSMKDELGVKRAAPTHCTGDEAIEVFEETFGEDFVWAGLGARVTIPD
jgi:7,8-dihydropterin-6-yl-methyl-4-(beta-D-ribofuranosyl)aminobenzene 5'-phosphate synthase